jgi:peptide/nickel transport system permease protein
MILGPLATQDEIDKLNSALHLDRNLFERYLIYFQGVLKLDLGESYFTGRPVLDDIFRRLPDTLQLIVPALVGSVLVGTVLGTIAAYYGRGVRSQFVKMIITLFQSTPDFVAALLLILALFSWLALAPTPIGQFDILMDRPPSYTGFTSIDALIAGDFAAFWSLLAHTILPAAALIIVYSSFFAKTVRTTMEQALKSAHTEFSRASGLSEYRVVLYALLRSRTVILTYVAMLFSSLLGGEAILETVFGWGGLGQWALEGMIQVDIPVIQGFILTAGMATLFIYLCLDLVVAWLDTRVRLA